MVLRNTLTFQENGNMKVNLIFLFSLVKNCDKRPNYVALLEHPFIKKYETETVDMGTYVKEILAFQEVQSSS